MRKRLFGFVGIVQIVLFLAHFFLYQTWNFQGPASHNGTWLRALLGVLSVSFVAASLLVFSHTNPVIRAFYRAAAVWIGWLSFLVLAAAISWIVFGVSTLVHLPLHFHVTVEILFALALLAGIYGVFNAGWTRVTRAQVQLENLPETWRGRKAALVSDVHLGPVRNGRFLRRL